MNKSATSRATKPLELVHTDVHGPMPVQTREGYKYWICFVDDATRLVAITPLKRKSDAFEAFKVYKTTMENQTENKILAERDDKGGECCVTMM